MRNFVELRFERERESDNGKLECGRSYMLGRSVILGDLKTRKIIGTSCQIEIYFSSQTSKCLIKYNLLRFQISGGLIIFFTEHD